jgi:hypothetical protein
LKKRTKKLSSMAYAGGERRDSGTKSFLLLFLEKEDLPSYSAAFKTPRRT